MIEQSVPLSFADGVLEAHPPHHAACAWTRPAALAEARLACEPPVAELAVTDGADALIVAFKVLPFVRGPLPVPTFGESVTPAARAAFRLLSSGEGNGVLHVLRGEVDDFIVFARTDAAAVCVGALSVAATTLTVRFEDVWRSLPPSARAFEYRVAVLDDNGEHVLEGVAPDARITLDVKANGGFMLTFMPLPRHGRGA